MAGRPPRRRRRGAPAPAAGSDLHPPRAAGPLGHLQLAARRLDPGQRAAQAHPAARPGRQGVRARAHRAAAAAGACARGRAAGRRRAVRHSRCHRRLRRAAAGHGHRRAARRPRGGPAPAAALVPGDREDVRVRADAGAGGGRPAGRPGVRRLRRRDGGAAPGPAGRRPGEPPRRGRGRRRAAVRARAGGHLRAAAQRRARGERQRVRQRPGHPAAKSRGAGPAAAGPVGPGAHRGGGVPALRRAAAAVRAHRQGGRRPSPVSGSRRGPRSPPCWARRTATPRPSPTPTGST